MMEVVKLVIVVEEVSIDIEVAESEIRTDTDDEGRRDLVVETALNNTDGLGIRVLVKVTLEGEHPIVFIFAALSLAIIILTVMTVIRDISLDIFEAAELVMDV